MFITNSSESDREQLFWQAGMTDVVHEKILDKLCQIWLEAVCRSVGNFFHKMSNKWVSTNVETENMENP